MPVKSSDIGWIAGLLEGEGSFGCLGNGSAPLIKLTMNDFDVVSRVAGLMGYTGTISQYKLSSGKICHTIQMYGDKSIQWMMTVYCLMGSRRKIIIKDILSRWRSNIPFQRTHCPNGHEYTSDNVYTDRRGNNSCRECRKHNQELQNLRRQTLRQLRKGALYASKVG